MTRRRAIVFAVLLLVSVGAYVRYRTRWVQVKVVVHQPPKPPPGE